MRPRRRHLIAAAIAVCLTGLGALLAAGGAGGARPATASAVAFERQSDAGTHRLVRVRGDGRRSAGGATARASTSGLQGSAAASASVRDVSILDGLVTARSVRVSASADGRSAARSGRVTGLRVDGRVYGTITSERRIPLGDAGTLTVLGRGSGGIAGLRARLTRARGGRPAGTTVTVAFASAHARDGSAPAARSGGGDRRRERGSKGRDRPERTERSAPRPPAAKAKAKRRRAPRLDPRLTGRGYVFPVYGKSSYTNDWGAPRAITIRHEGNDIFAPTGTPVLAVTDGRLSRVGTRPVPGNRLWLENAEGDTFFYAHLSAFSHDARNGARVRAGDVIGFVGSTGDAEKTPPHLHFEVHPGDGDAVNPYPFLRAWQSRRDVPRAAWLERYGNDPGSRPGALVVLEDYLER